MYGVQFSLCGIRPFTVVVSFVKFQSFSIVSLYEKAKHIFLCMPDLSYFRLFNSSGEFFFLFDEMSNSFPSIKIIQVLLCCISSTSDGIISCYYTQWFKCSFACFPFNLNIPFTAFPIGVSCFLWAFMTNFCSKFIEFLVHRVVLFFCLL